MAKTSRVPFFVRLVNILTTSLVRAGFKVGAAKAPMYLLTVRGRKSGQPRTTPIVVAEQDGKRYLVAPYGLVDWVRNLRAAGEATLTHGRRSEVVRARELSPTEAGLVLKGIIEGGTPFDRYFGVTAASSSHEDFERATVLHPVFLLQSAR